MAAKAGEEAASPARTEWNLGDTGVKGIVQTLETNTATSSTPPLDIPGTRSPVYQTPPTTLQTPPTVYQTPAEKVSDILRRPVPTHTPRKYTLPTRVVHHTQERLVQEHRRKNRYALV